MCLGIMKMPRNTPFFKPSYGAIDQILKRGPVRGQTAVIRLKHSAQPEHIAEAPCLHHRNYLKKTSKAAAAAAKPGQTQR